LIVFEIPNEKELEVIYEENSLYMKKKPWYEMYEYAIDGDHDFLFINYQQPKKLYPNYKPPKKYKQTTL